MPYICTPLRKVLVCLSYVTILLLISACTRSAVDKSNFWISENSNAPPTQQITEITSEKPFVAARLPGDVIISPTPDSPHDIPALSIENDYYEIQYGDTLGEISQRLGVSTEQLVIANQIENPNVLEIGQILEIPVPEPGQTGPGFKIIPDSEMVFGPYAYQFEINKFVQEINGYLVYHEEEVDGIEITGVEIVQRVSTNFSINPRLLIALLEYQSHWLTDRNPRTSTLEYPLGLNDNNRKGLYKQLTWAANQLNRGYYLWRINAVSFWTLVDGNIVPADPTINSGTAAVQYYFSNFFTREKWQKAVSEDGLYSTFFELFGYPFDYAFEPLVPSDISQPILSRWLGRWVCLGSAGFCAIE
jgi:LysM repeat protein